MTTGTALSDTCVGDVFVLLAAALARAGHPDPIAAAVRLTAAVVDRVERSLPVQGPRLPDPSPN